MPFHCNRMKVKQMKAEKVIYSHWNEQKKLIITRIAGEVDRNDIEKWTMSLLSSLKQVPTQSEFKILIDLFGFRALDLEVHKKFRTVIPLTLARYGWKVGYVALFDEGTSLSLSTEDGIKCVAAAHVHQDETKMEKYQSLFGTDKEAFFTDPLIAERWLEQLKV